jgi:hypothetical protein
MSRQKVKGTGHKQPADAKTEPNFYDMRPADEAAEMAALHSFQMSMDSHNTQLPLSQTSLFQDFTPGMTMMSPAPIPSYAPHSAAAATYASPQAWTSFRQPPLGSVLDSPASPGLHGAAHLLQNIASGYTTTNAPALPMPSVDASLGPPATDTSSANQVDGSGNDPSSMDPPNPRRPATTFLQPRLSSPFDLKKSWDTAPSSNRAFVLVYYWFLLLAL